MALENMVSRCVMRNTMQEYNWAALHQTELWANWELARQQAPLQGIEPLE